MKTLQNVDWKLLQRQTDALEDLITSFDTTESELWDLVEFLHTLINENTE